MCVSVCVCPSAMTLKWHNILSIPNTIVNDYVNTSTAFVTPLSVSPNFLIAISPRKIVRSLSNFAQRRSYNRRIFICLEYSTYDQIRAINGKYDQIWVIIVTFGQIYVVVNVGNY